MSEFDFLGRFVGVGEEQDLERFHTFYESFGSGVKRPPSIDWSLKHVGKSFFPMLALHKDEVAGALWIHSRPHHVYMEEVNGFLHLRNRGPYAEVGGMQVHPDFIGKEVNSLLCAMVWARWFAWPNSKERNNGNRSLWARIPGRMTEDGMPVFWKQMGEELTGISYRDLINLPFDEQDVCIWNHWPVSDGEKVPVEITSELRKNMLGRAARELIAYRKFFESWGLRNVGRYAAHSLNTFFYVNGETTKVPEHIQRMLGLSLTHRKTK